MDNIYFEAVETCPHCEKENVYPMWDANIKGFVAVCKYCGKYKCPPPCPSYQGESAERGKPIGICRKCGGYIYRYDDYFDGIGGLVCDQCFCEAVKKS